MQIERMFLGVAAGLFAFSVPTAVATAQNTDLPILRALEPGEWTVKFRDGRPQQRICLRNGYELVQLRHGMADCNRFVVEDSPTAVTIQYTCAGNGYARTSLRRETATLVQLESRGIANGQPFEMLGEARKTGNCD